MFFLQGEDGLIDIKPKHVANLFVTIKYPPQYNSCVKTVITIHFNSLLICESCIRHSGILDTVFIQYKLMLLQLLLLLLLPTTTTTTTTTTTSSYKINQSVSSTAAKYLCMPSLSLQLTTGESCSNSEASSEPSSLVDKKEAQSSLPSGGILRQNRESGPSTSTQNESPQEEEEEKEKEEEGEEEENPRLIPIFQAVSDGDLTILSNLLTNSNTGVNTIDINGDTALLHAVARAFDKDGWDVRYYKCIHMLMSCEEMKVNMPNRNGYTAIGLAVLHHNRSYIERMLQHPSAKRLHLDYYPAGNESTMREIIMQKYPALESLLPAPLMESLDSSDRDIKLLAALQHDKYDIFSENLDSENPNPSYDEPYYSSLLEIACQMKNRKQFVELLLDSGADPNIKNRVTGMPLLHATARSGNFEVLEILLKRQNLILDLKDNKERTILHWWARVRERKHGDKKRLENFFKHLLQVGYCSQVGIDCKDMWGITPLCTAIVHQNRDRVIMLLRNGADVTAVECFDPILQSCSSSVLEDILDYCLDSNKGAVNSEHLMVTLRYRTLEKMLFLAEVPHHKHILRHPVFSIFLNLTWKRTMKLFFSVNVAFYVMFLTFLTVYILHSESVDTPSHKSVANNTNGLLTFNDSLMTPGMKDTSLYNISQALRYFLMILLGLLCMREAFQVFVYHWRYIKSLENWLELLLIIVTFTLCSGIVDSIETKRHLFVIAILLGWFELVLLLGRLPQLSVQMEMLKTVSLTFLRFMAGYIVLLVAFAFSFYLLFKGTVKVDHAVHFDNPFTSLMRTIIMFTGEFDASNLPFDTLPGTSHVVFMMFVFFVAIILLNLLNGLAVGDTGKVREDAETLSLVARARLISNAFEVFDTLPQSLTRSLELTEEMFVLYPNRPNQLGPTELRSLLNIITKKRKPSEKETSIEENWSLFTEQLSTLQLQSEEMRKILMKILTRLDIQEP